MTFPRRLIILCLVAVLSLLPTSASSVPRCRLSLRALTVVVAGTAVVFAGLRYHQDAKDARRANALTKQFSPEISNSQALSKVDETQFGRDMVLLAAARLDPKAEGHVPPDRQKNFLEGYLEMDPEFAARVRKAGSLEAVSSDPGKLGWLYVEAQKRLAQQIDAKGGTVIEAVLTTGKRIEGYGSYSERKAVLKRTYSSQLAAVLEGKNAASVHVAKSGKEFMATDIEHDIRILIDEALLGLPRENGTISRQAAEGLLKIFQTHYMRNLSATDAFNTYELDLSSPEALQRTLAIRVDLKPGYSLDRLEHDLRVAGLQLELLNNAMYYGFANGRYDDQGRYPQLSNLIRRLYGQKVGDRDIADPQDD